MQSEEAQPVDIPAAVAAAKAADLVILYVGGTAGWYGDDLTEKEGGDTANIDLPSPQMELVNAITALGKPTIAVVVMGRPQGIAPGIMARESFIELFRCTSRVYTGAFY